MKFMVMMAMILSGSMAYAQCCGTGKGPMADDEASASVVVETVAENAGAVQ